MLHTAEMVWHDDGHVLYLEINQAELVVQMVSCPHGPQAPCRVNRHVGCVVEHFVFRFGLEVNVGVCPAAAELPVAWALAGDPTDVDLCQVWIVPTADEVFAAWAATMRGALSDETS
jgi:hypothetical protein